MKCRSCGEEIAESNKFCGICGAPNTAREEAQNDRIGESAAEEQIDDILNSYGGKSEEEANSWENSKLGWEDGNEEPADKETDAAEDAEGAVGIAENAEQERTADFNGKKSENIPQNFQGGNPQYNPNNMPYGNYPPYNQNGYYGSNMNGYPQNPAFVPLCNQNNQNDGKKEESEKEKKTISVGVAVFCIIVALIMSAFCGFLLETCLRNNINPFAAAKTGSVVHIPGLQDILRNLQIIL